MSWLHKAARVPTDRPKLASSKIRVTDSPLFDWRRLKTNLQESTAPPPRSPVRSPGKVRRAPLLRHLEVFPTLQGLPPALAKQQPRLLVAVFTRFGRLGSDKRRLLLEEEDWSLLHVTDVTTVTRGSSRVCFSPPFSFQDPKDPARGPSSKQRLREYLFVLYLVGEEVDRARWIRGDPGGQGEGEGLVRTVSREELEKLEYVGESVISMYELNRLAHFTANESTPPPNAYALARGDVGPCGGCRHVYELVCNPQRVNRAFPSVIFPLNPPPPQSTSSGGGGGGGLPSTPSDPQPGTVALGVCVAEFHILEHTTSQSRSGSRSSATQVIETEKPKSSLARYFESLAEESSKHRHGRNMAVASSSSSSARPVSSSLVQRAAAEHDDNDEDFSTLGGRFVKPRTGLLDAKNQRDLGAWSLKFRPAGYGSRFTSGVRKPGSLKWEAPEGQLFSALEAAERRRKQEREAGKKKVAVEKPETLPFFRIHIQGDVVLTTHHVTRRTRPVFYFRILRWVQESFQVVYMSPPTTSQIGAEQYEALSGDRKWGGGGGPESSCDDLGGLFDVMEDVMEYFFVVDWPAFSISQEVLDHAQANHPLRFEVVCRHPYGRDQLVGAVNTCTAQMRNMHGKNHSLRCTATRDSLEAFNSTEWKGPSKSALDQGLETSIAQLRVRSFSFAPEKYVRHGISPCASSAPPGTPDGKDDRSHRISEDSLGDLSARKIYFGKEENGSPHGAPRSNENDETRKEVADVDENDEMKPSGTDSKEAEVKDSGADLAGLDPGSATDVKPDCDSVKNDREGDIASASGEMANNFEDQNGTASSSNVAQLGIDHDCGIKKDKEENPTPVDEKAEAMQESCPNLKESAPTDSHSSVEYPKPMDVPQMPNSLIVDAKVEQSTSEQDPLNSTFREWLDSEGNNNKEPTSDKPTPTLMVSEVPDNESRFQQSDGNLEMPQNEAESLDEEDRPLDPRVQASEHKSRRPSLRHRNFSGVYEPKPLSGPCTAGRPTSAPAHNPAEVFKHDARLMHDILSDESLTSAIHKAIDEPLVSAVVQVCNSEAPVKFYRGSKV